MGVQSFTEYPANGKANGVIETGRNATKKPTIFQINEWTFSLFLLMLSLSIVAGKLYINYGPGTQFSNNVRKSAHSFLSNCGKYDIFGVPSSQQLSPFDKDRFESANEKLTNVSQEHSGPARGTTDRYGWLFVAALSGMTMMSITWFIIYKDSSIPGVNPPSPFSPSKTRYQEKSRLQINYLVGILNGVLVFVYMCL